MQSKSPSTTKLARRAVLVIDDHPAMTTSLKLMLALEHDVDTATDARTALQRLEASKYDVILCDLAMPKVSGIDLYREVERRDPALAARFVFMTGGATNAVARAFLEQTKLRVLEKPFTVEALHAALIEP